MRNYLFKTIIFLFLVGLTVRLNAADRYWVGTTNNNWNNTGNWSTSSGGASGASVPGASDRALFNSSGNINCTLDIAPTVESMDISVGYTATIDLNGNNLTINGATTNDFEDGVFNNTSGGALSITCSGITYLRGSTFNPNITVTSARLYLNGSNYNGTCTVTKTGSGNDASIGGNVWASSLTMNNSGSGYLMMGNGTQDSITGNLIMNNTGSQNMYLAYNSSGTYVSGNLTINNNAASGNAYVYVSDLTGSSITVAGNLIANNIGAGSNNNLYLGDDGSLTVSGTTTVTNNITGTNGTVYLGTQTTGSATLVGNVVLTNSSVGGTNSNIYLGNNGDVTCSGTVVANNTSGATTNQISIANGANSTVTIAGTTTVNNSGSGTTGRCWIGNAGDAILNGNATLNNSSTATNSQVYCSYSTGSSVAFNQNLVITSSNAASDGILFGASSAGITTLATGKTITIGGAGFLAGQLYFRNFTQSGGTAQSLALTGTGYMYQYDSDWGGNVTFTSPRFITRGTRYRGTANITKNGTSDDQSPGGNQFDGNTTITCSGGGYIMMGNGTADTFGANLTLDNTGTRGIYLAYNSAGNTVAGNLIATNSGTGSSTWIYLSDLTASSLTVTGNVDITVSGTSTTCVARLGNTGDVTVGGNLTWTKTSSSTTTDCYIAQAAASAVSVGGNLTYSQSGAGTNGRMYIGSYGDVTVTGDMTLTNASTASNSQIYCNDRTGSVGVYSGNIVVTSSGANSDGVNFGRNGGSSTLAATKTITVGVGGFSSGDLYFRNFTQTGATAQSLANSGTGYIYNYDSDWGGNVTFSSGRINTRGTRYRGTATITKNGISDDQCVGGNQFDGNTILNCTNSGYLMMGNGSSDAFISDLTLNNSGTRGIYIAYNSAGNTVGGNLTTVNSGTGTSTWIYLSDLAASSLTVTGNVDVTQSGTSSTGNTRIGNSGDVTIGGNVTWVRTSSVTTSDCYIANAAASSVSIGGALTYTQSGAGTNGRMYIGNYGDVTVTGTMTLTNSSTASNSQIYCNYRTGSVGTYNGNIVLASSVAGADGVLFGTAGGTATLAATRTVSAGAGGFISGDLYFWNFTQVGATAQTFTNTGTGYIHNQNSNWGGNVTFSAGRIISNGTTYQGTLTLSKTNTGTDQSIGGNTVTGNTILNASGSGQFYMGNGIKDVFGGDVTMNNTGTNSMYLAYRAPGNTIAGNLVMNNTGSGTTNNMYLASIDTSSLAITGNLTLTHSSTATTSGYIYLADAGDLTIGGNMTLTNSATSTNSYIYIANNTAASVAVTGNFSLNSNGSSSNSINYIGYSGDVTIGGTLTALNQATGSQGHIYIANNATSSVSVTGASTLLNTGSGATKRIYAGNLGDVTFGGDLDIKNTSSATSSQVYCNHQSGSVNAYNGNITLESSNPSSDGILFGTSGTGGSGTLAATKTVSASGGGITAGDIYFRNFTQVGATAQSLVNSGTGYIYNYDSDWGGNVNFSGGRMYTRGTIYRGTATLSKTGASDDNCPGGNTFTGNATLNNSGTRYFLMGNGSPDVFSANLTMNNSSSYNMYLAYNSAGNSIAGDLVINNSATGGTNYIYISDLAASTLSIGGNATINNTASSSNSVIYFGDDGDVSLTGNLTATNSSTGAASSLTVGQVATSLVTIGGNATMTNSGSGTNSNLYFGNNGDVTLTGNLILTNSATGTNGQTYLANASTSNVTIGGTSTVSNSGAGTTKRVYFANYGDVTVSGDLSLLNSSSATNSQIYCNDRTGSVAAYNGNIVIESSNAASDGVYFGLNAGSATLAATKTITVGGGGFISGDIWLRNFTQVGATAQSLVNSGTGYIYNYDSDWGGNVNFSGGRMYTRGTIYRGTATLSKTGASDDNCPGGNTFTGNATLNNSGTRYFLMGNGSPDVFSANLTMNNSGTYHMYLGQNSAGNSVGGNLIVNNSGSGSTNYIYISNAAASTLSVTGTSTFTNSSTATTSYIYVGEQGDITFNNNVTLTNSGTGTNGYIQMANNTNSVVSVTGNVTATNSASGTTKRIYLTNIGDLTISGSLTATNSSSANIGEIYIGNNSASTVSVGGNSVFSNSGAGATKRCYIGNYGDVTFTGNLSLLNSSSASNSQIYCNDRTGSVNSYLGNLVVESSNAACDGVFFGTNGGSGTLAATKTITVSGGGFIAGQLYFRNFTQTGGTAQSLTLTGTGYMYHYNSAWGGNVAFKAPRFYTRTTTYSGTSTLEKSGATDDASPGGNSFTGACTMINSGSGYFLMGNGTADTWASDLTMTSSGTDHMYIAHNSAGNSIGGNLVSTNGGTGNVYHYISTNTVSTLSISGNATLSNSGSGTNINTYFGNSGDVTLTGNLIATNSASGTNGYLYVGYGTTSSVSIGGTATVTNSGAGTTKRTYLGSQGDVSITGDLTITNSSSASNSQFYCNNSSNSANTYGGNISVVSSNASCDGVYFGSSGGAATQSAGGNISIGGSGFISGQLYFRNFTQLGSAASSLTLTGTGYLYNYNSTFGGNFTCSSPRSYSRGTTYNGVTSLTKSGTSNDASAGGNTFNGDVTFTNNSTSYFMQANGTADDYNGNVTYVKTSTGLMYPTYAASSTYAGNISFNTNTAITLGANTGTVIMDGTGAQSINELAASPEPIFRRLTLNNSANEITLNRPITIRTTMTFTNGNLITTSANLLHVNDEATVSGASDNSHVDGPVEKIGNNAFEFPVGDGGRFRPISISAPSSNSARFEAQYFEVDPSTLYGWGTLSWESPIVRTSTREYWILNRTSGTNAVSVTLSWNTNSGGVTDLGTLTVCRHDGSIWKNHGNGGTTGNTTSGTIVSSGSISSFSPFTLGSTNINNNPLPVELVEFDAKPNFDENSVELIWATASEINSNYFEIERTISGSDYESLGTIKAKGFSNKYEAYRLYDLNPLQGTSYYRLKQIDLDGTVNYTELKKVIFEKGRISSKPTISIFPNPSSEYIIVDGLIGSNEGAYSIWNLDGKIVQEGALSDKGFDRINFDNDIVNGVYFLRIVVNGGVQTHKLIVQ